MKTSIRLNYSDNKVNLIPQQHCLYKKTYTSFCLTDDWDHRSSTTGRETTIILHIARCRFITHDVVVATFRVRQTVCCVWIVLEMKYTRKLRVSLYQFKRMELWNEDNTVINYL